MKSVDLSALSPLLAAVGAADLALERVNEIIATLRTTDAGNLVGIGQLRKLSESYRLSALETFDDLTKRGEAAFGGVLMAIEKMAPVMEIQTDSRGGSAPRESADIERTYAFKKAPAKKAPAKKAAVKKAEAKKYAPAKKSPAKKPPAAAKRTPRR
nr:hypothetical protein [Mycolicibacterium aichiense]